MATVGLSDLWRFARPFVGPQSDEYEVDNGDGLGNGHNATGGDGYGDGFKGFKGDGTGSGNSETRGDGILHGRDNGDGGFR